MRVHFGDYRDRALRLDQVTNAGRNFVAAHDGARRHPVEQAERGLGLARCHAKPGRAGPGAPVVDNRKVQIIQRGLSLSHSLKR